MEPLFSFQGKLSYEFMTPMVKVTNMQMVFLAYCMITSIYAPKGPDEQLGLFRFTRCMKLSTLVLL